MCNYCLEESAIQILCSDVCGNLKMKDLVNNLYIHYYLRETPDFISALDKLTRSKVRIKAVDTFELPPFLAKDKPPILAEVSPEVILYRGLEILLKHGFASPLYQKLLRKSLYRNAIAVTCSVEKRELFESATAGLSIEYLGLLYDAETYLWGERSKQLRTLTQVLPPCRNLLKNYIACLHAEKKREKNDLNVTLNENGVHDSNNDTNEDYSWLSLYDRALYFSVLTVGSCLAGKKMLLAIVQNNPAIGPNLLGEDLWIQRVAALKLFDLEGLEAFSKHMPSIRDIHYYYINLVRCFSAEQMQLLQDEVNRHLETGNTHPYLVRVQKWLKSPFGRYFC